MVPTKKGEGSHPRPSITLLFSTMVTITVGSEKKAFVVHKDLICHYSKYFKAAFGGNFKEAEEKKSNLPDVETETFEIFVAWLYKQKLDIEAWKEEKDIDGSLENACNCADTDDMGEDPNFEFVGADGKPLSLMDDHSRAQTIKRLRAHPVDRFELRLVQLAILADKCDVPLLRNAVVDALHDNFRDNLWLPALCIIKSAFQELPRAQPFCKYIDSLVEGYLDSHQLSKSTELFKELVTETMGALFWQRMATTYRRAYTDCRPARLGFYPWTSKKMKTPYWSRSGFCERYHKHDKDERCS
ncbi:hypothetical protein NA57DRAFT_75742 [Rhizodiscina lignyota]|uniref:BTB domain-containing protein n=1 Tax=Rhizodiscina lignyota TaxID=1504668 RepID=A0A9P4M638_9PEZI|nr:hypothetical protein NA57DRAFT_75742 [Rhizodiscina lignyota]